MSDQGQVRLDIVTRDSIYGHPAMKHVDPDVMEARMLIRPQMHERDAAFCDYVERGLRDDCPEMRIAVAAIKRGRELAAA